MQKWVKAFEDANLTMEEYTLRERSEDEILPWDFIDCGVTKAFLLRERKNAYAETVTPNCRQQCSGCGSASYKGGVCFENKN